MRRQFLPNFLRKRVTTIWSILCLHPECHHPNKFYLVYIDTTDSVLNVATPWDISSLNDHDLYINLTDHIEKHVLFSLCHLLRKDLDIGAVACC